MFCLPTSNRSSRARASVTVALRRASHAVPSRLTGIHLRNCTIDLRARRLKFAPLPRSRSPPVTVRALASVPATPRFHESECVGRWLQRLELHCLQPARACSAQLLLLWAPPWWWPPSRRSCCCGAAAHLRLASCCHPRSCRVPLSLQLWGFCTCFSPPCNPVLRVFPAGVRSVKRAKPRRPT